MLTLQMARTRLMKTPVHSPVDFKNYMGPEVHVNDASVRQASLSEQTSAAVIILHYSVSKGSERSWGDGTTALVRNGAQPTAPT